MQLLVKILVSLFVMIMVILMAVHIWIRLHYFIPFTNVTTVNYADIKHHLKTGDLILFQSKTVRFPTYRWVIADSPTHVGMIYRAGNELYCVDSISTVDNSSAVPDLVMPVKIGGPRVVRLETLLRYYITHKPGNVFIRQINKSFVSGDGDSNLETQLRNHGATPFNTCIFNFYDLPTAIFLWEIGLKEIASWYHKHICGKDGVSCCEYVIDLYIQYGVMSNRAPPWTFAPFMLTSKSHKFTNNLTNGYNFGKEVGIVF